MPEIKEPCPGAAGLDCVGGWLYSSIGMMIFSANRQCPVCNPPEEEPLTEASL